MRTIGIIVKRNRQQVFELVKSIVPLLQSEQAVILVENVIEPFDERVQFCSRAQVVGQSDLLLVFGGDGTLLAAARAVRDDIVVLCHGGPIAMPEDAQYVLQRTGNVHGFYGASSMERLPVETALTEQVRRFKSISLG